MTTRMTPHGEQEIDDFYEAPEAPIACRSCGSPACEWPGECKPAGQLPIVENEVWTRARAIRDRLVVK